MGALSLWLFNASTDKGLGDILQEQCLPRRGRARDQHRPLPPFALTQQEDGTSLVWSTPCLP